MSISSQPSSVPSTACATASPSPSAIPLSGGHHILSNNSNCSSSSRRRSPGIPQHGDVPSPSSSPSPSPSSSPSPSNVPSHLPSAPARPPLADDSDDGRPALNPFAKEFIPIHASSSQDFATEGEATEGETSVGVHSCSPTQGLSGDLLNDKRQRTKPHKGDAVPRSGGLFAALKQGNGKTSAVSKIGEDSPDGLPYQTVPSVSGVGKRAQFTNANYLLNFQYDPIVRPPTMPRIPYNRKVQKIQPFNKELFLQANFRFLVSDYGDYLLNSSDPDKMLPWEDIAAVNVSAPTPIQCPICLESPSLCPQITTCGHIFCFPCILRYLALGENQQKSDYHKKCPLCFAMISSKALRTVIADDVHNYQAGDYLELTLLNRAKGSMIPYEKSHPVVGTLPFSKDGQCHSFSKFTLTSDADHITNKAIAELSSWAEKTQNGTDEDVDLHPYVFLAIEQLQQRKSAWDEHRVSEFLSSSPPVRHRIMAQSSKSSSWSAVDTRTAEGSLSVYEGKQEQKEDVTGDVGATRAALKNIGRLTYESAFSDDDDYGDAGVKAKLFGGNITGKDMDSMISSPDIPSSWEDNLEERLEKTKLASVVEKTLREVSNIDVEEDEYYTFYQCADGQPLILHPLNMKCMLQHYGSHENLPSRLRARILEMEAQIQTDTIRKRYRYLSHLPLTTNFWFCELDLRGVLPSSAFSLCIEEIRAREARRRRRRKQDEGERARSDRMPTVENRILPPIPLIENNLEEQTSFASEETFSKSPPIVEPARDDRKLFSEVTRLGYASAHDAPELVPKNSQDANLSSGRASTSAGASTSKASGMSFADAIQSQSSKSTPKSSDGASSLNTKKSKKASKVILSTAGGRRY